MVRFHWHVEDGSGAFIPASGMEFEPGSAVQHVSCSIEITGEAPAVACITVPRGYLTQGSVNEVGVLLGHDKAEEWRGPLMTALAVALAEAGHVVVRYHSDGKELRRQRLYEKALDVCATSPFARFVQRWVLAGVGHGARLAAVVGSRARGTVCGYVLLSYPVSDTLQTAKGPVLPDSSILLLRLQAPVLFVQGAADGRVAVEQMRRVSAQMKPAASPRLVAVPGVDGSFLSGEPPALAPATLDAIRQPLVNFMAAVAAGKPGDCSVPLANADGAAAAELSDGAAAGIAAQVAILDEDDSAVYDVEPLGTKAGDAAAAAATGSQQAKAQQLLQLQQAVLQQQQAQLAAAAKAGMLQQAAAQRAASGAAPMMLQLTPQMLAAAQAMQLAAAKQGMRPQGGNQ